MLTLHAWRRAGLAAAALFIAPACAVHDPFIHHPAPVHTVDDRAYQIGYREGLDHGASDARGGRRFDVDRHRAYRTADVGYRGYGDPNAYRHLFRQGFVSGYEEGYRRYARGGYQYPDRGSRGGYPPVYGSPRYEDPRLLAGENGYRDGFDQGRDDARDGDRFDPVRASRYRSGDRGYNNRYGSRDDYKRAYRAAFQQGYADGYGPYRR